MAPGSLRVAIAAAALLLAGSARAFHTVFDFTIDRFEVDGNTFGPHDGTLDWVDDFNGTSTSNWYTPYGTSSVSGGRLQVRSPGEHYPGPDGTTLDFTEVASASQVSKALGSFTATAIFDPIIPPEGHFYHFTLYTFGGEQYFNELFGIDIHTSGGETRSAGGSCNGRLCWRALGTRGFAYKNRKAVNAIGSLKLTATGRTGSQVAVTARGPSLFESAPPLAFPVTVQLEADTGTCWSATFQTSSPARRGGY